ncbi:MAG TPA: DNA primase [Accumulibacter sp.]|nr:DNA primase [Accumulibacter sp.]HMW16612.1 DNA primase [Accumulibacter sp.]HMX23846.1 DNA primase [Accumulibacter sp.]HMY05494.1 DNA primase [Accumulibacter sp.]HNC16680.1 DNA primase [Accumulibacter sp.]
MIPESFIQGLLQRIDIIDLIDGYVPLKKAGANFAACCPFHAEKSPSFTVSPSKQFYHCFGCGAHGTAIGFLMEYAGLGFVDAVKDLAHRAGVSVPEEAVGSDSTSPPRFSSPALTELMTRASQFYRQQLKRSQIAIAYLKERGLGGEISREFGIGYAPANPQSLSQVFEDYGHPDLQLVGLVIKNDKGRLYDRFRERVIFPILSQKGEVIAFGGRVIGAGEPKYLNSPETPLFEKGNELFGLTQARAAIRQSEAVIVVEGYMDVVALAQHGIGNVVAALGTATTSTHVRKLLRQADRVIFCFDGDSAGRKAAWRALENSLEILTEQKSINFVFLPESDDPDSFVRREGQDAFRRLVEHAMPLSDFMLREMSRRCDLTSAEGRAKLIADARPLLGRLSSPLLRLQLTKRLATVSGFSQVEVERLCNLRPIVGQAPGRAPRPTPPSIIRRLLPLVLQKPQLAMAVPLNLLSATSQETQALRQLCETIAQSGDQPPAYPALLERLRGSGNEGILQAAAAELLELPFAEEAIDEEFAGALRQLRDNEMKRTLESLQEKVRRLGVGGLSSEEKQRYLQAIRGCSGAPTSSDERKE